jgi:hypothetical protein
LRIKKMFWLVGGLCAAAAGFLAWGARRSEPVADLARRMEEPRDQPPPESSQPDEVLEA